MTFASGSTDKFWVTVLLQMDISKQMNTKCLLCIVDEKVT